MNDDAPYKSRVYSPWPVVVLILFFGAAITLWESDYKILAIILGAVGIITFSIWDKVRTKIMQEEFSFRALFKNW